MDKAREQKQRLIKVAGGVGVGTVSVLKENFYDLKDGEPSVYGKGGELDRTARASVNDSSYKRTKMLRAGVDYRNLDHCQACGQFGEVVLCDGCPMAWHPTCMGFKSVKGTY